jgi:hypothetical protein
MLSTIRSHAHRQRFQPVGEAARLVGRTLFLMAVGGSAFAALAWVPPGPEIGGHSPSLYFGAALLIATAAVAAMLTKAQSLMPARQCATAARGCRSVRPANLAAQGRPRS